MSEATATQDGVRQGLSVLVVDDDRELRQALEEFFTRDGYRVTGVGGLGEALERLKGDFSPFDVVLVDLRLPDGDGSEIVRALHRDFPETVPVIMTGYASLESALEALRLGAYDYITKPFKFEELESLMGRIREQVRLNREHRRALAKLEELTLTVRSLQQERIEFERLRREFRVEFERTGRKLDYLIDLVKGLPSR